MTFRKALRSLSLVALLLAPASASTADDLSGTYLYIQETTSVTKMPVLADVVARTRAVSIQRLNRDGEWLRGTGTLCDVRLTTSSSLVKTTLPPSFRRALPPVRTNAKLTRTKNTIEFLQPPQTLVLGAKLKNKASSALPRTPNDPRVIDDDRDGNPGVTVRVSGIVSGEIYLVQRSTSRLTGHATPDGFHGRIHFSNDQRILDATRSVLKRDPGATPDPKRSWFHLKRLAGPISCREAVRIASTF